MKVSSENVNPVDILSTVMAYDGTSSKQGAAPGCLRRSTAHLNITDLSDDTQMFSEQPPGCERTQSCGDLRSTPEPNASADQDTVISQGTDFIPDDKPVVHGVTVKGAVVEKLIACCLECFRIDGAIENDSKFPYVFFLMHKWFMESDRLAIRLFELYQSQCSSGLSSLSDSSETMLRICYTLRYWIDTFPIHFEPDSNLSGILRDFAQDLQNQGHHQQLELIDISNVPSYDWIRKVTVRAPSSKEQQKRVSLVFNKIDHHMVAEQLTFIEWKAVRRITFLDFKDYAMNADLRENPRLERSVQLFNGLTQWVQCMILHRTTPKQRAEVMLKYIKIAETLRELQNFNSLMSVIGGLCHSSIARLTKTMACLSLESQKTLNEFTELLSSSSNYGSYRKALSECSGFKIPILGVHMKDLISIHTAFPDYLENDLINFRKMTQFSLIFSDLMDLQKAKPPVNPNMDLVNTLMLALDMCHTEDEIYELSLAREPRNSISSPSSPTRSPVFADWAAGLSSPPDPQTINKHVKAMIEAVFKNYDHDRDGFISNQEFEEIASNFPFIDSFAVLDADQDGMISQPEMMEYFVRANSHALRNEFKHNFHETTYFKPTYCAHCTGLLWGLIKQGWKCRDCGLSAHKHCKDCIVMECRPKKHKLTPQRILSVGGPQPNPAKKARNRFSRRPSATQMDAEAKSRLCPQASGEDLSSSGSRDDVFAASTQALHASRNEPRSLVVNIIHDPDVDDDEDEDPSGLTASSDPSARRSFRVSRSLRSSRRGRQKPIHSLSSDESPLPEDVMVEVEPIIYRRLVATEKRWFSMFPFHSSDDESPFGLLEPDAHRSNGQLTSQQRDKLVEEKKNLESRLESAEEEISSLRSRISKIQVESDEERTAESRVRRASSADSPRSDSNT